MSMMNTTRLNKYIAQSGVCSRRRADELITNGNVKINGAGLDDKATAAEIITQAEALEQQVMKQEQEILEIVKGKI